MTKAAYWGSNPTFSSRFWEHVDKRSDDECWPWTATTRAKGYGQTLMRDEFGTKHNVCSHRVAYWITHGPFDWNLRVCHRCDNPRCCNPNHLFLGTTRDNVLDRIRKGRNRPTATQTYVLDPPKGERNSKAKLTEQQVRTVRSLRASGHSPYDIAFLFSVHYTTIKYILSGYRWKHVA